MRSNPSRRSSVMPRPKALKGAGQSAVSSWCSAAAAAASITPGKRIVKTAPPPGRSATLTAASCISAIRFTIAKPSPALPARRRSRRQNRRKICSRSALGTPGPRSMTLSSPAAATEISTVLPGSVWASAFSTRLRTARPSVSALPRTGTGWRAPVTATVLCWDSASGAM